MLSVTGMPFFYLVSLFLRRAGTCLYSTACLFPTLPLLPPFLYFSSRAYRQGLGCFLLDFCLSWLVRFFFPCLFFYYMAACFPTHATGALPSVSGHASRRAGGRSISAATACGRDGAGAGRRARHCCALPAARLQPLPLIRLHGILRRNDGACPAAQAAQARHFCTTTLPRLPRLAAETPAGAACRAPGAALGERAAATRQQLAARLPTPGRFRFARTAFACVATCLAQISPLPFFTVPV